ncbi:MAG: DUF4388 domain-containing protein [Planctomycetota bacterium]|jgi:tetratricopeptide (TPR) repeat protein
MSFEGDLKTLSLPQVLQLLSGGKQTGTLHIQTGRLTHLIYFEEGQIAAYAPGLRDPIDVGSALCKTGVLSRSLVEFVAKKAASTGRSLGNHLVATGSATAEAVTEAVYNAVKEQLFEMLMIRIGLYEFKQSEFMPEEFDPHHLEFPYRINAGELMIENLRRQEEWKDFEALLPSADIVLERHVHNKNEWNKLDAPTGHAKELSLVDGRRSIAEIMEVTTLSSFELYRVLCASLNKDFIALPRKHRMAELGDEAAKQGDAVAAIKFFTNAMMRDQLDHLIRLRFARHLVELGLTGDAFEQLIVLGEQFEHLGQPDFAETFYQEALEIIPDHIEAKRRLEKLRAEKSGEKSPADLSQAPPSDENAEETPEEPAEKIEDEKPAEEPEEEDNATTEDPSDGEDAPEDEPGADEVPTMDDFSADYVSDSEEEEENEEESDSGDDAGATPEEPAEDEDEGVPAESDASESKSQDSE